MGWVPVEVGVSEFLTQAALAKLMVVSRQYVNQLVKKGKIPSELRGGTRKIPASWLETEEGHRYVKQIPIGEVPVETHEGESEGSEELGV
jgi:excisionase family DNA binding protein